MADLDLQIRGGGGRGGMAGHLDPEIRQGVAGAGPGLKNFS